MLQRLVLNVQLLDVYFVLKQLNAQRKQLGMPYFKIPFINVKKVVQNAKPNLQLIFLVKLKLKVSSFKLP